MNEVLAAVLPKSGPGALPGVFLSRKRDERACQAGARLKLRRLQLSLTVGAVADKLGIQVGRYRGWEIEFGKLAQGQYLNAVAGVFNVNPMWISRNEGPEPLPGLQFDCLGGAPLTVRLKADHRQFLAVRAKERRLALQLGRGEVADAIGMDAARLSISEICLTARVWVEVEAKWEEILQVPRGWLRDLAVETPARALQQPIAAIEDGSGGSSVCVALEIRAVSCWLARKSIHRRNTQYSDLNEGEKRYADVFALRYGVAGEDASLLQAIGDRYSLTRERIRQMVVKLVDRATDLKVETPAMHELAARIAALVPATTAELDEKLRPLLGESLSILSVERFAREILGRSVVTLTDSPADMGAKWAVVAVDPQSHDPEVIRAVREAALRMIRSCGAAHVYFVAGAAGEALNRGINPTDVLRACQVVTGFEWLVKEDGWFWYGPARENRLLYVVKKILASAGRRVDIEDIHCAMARARRGYHDPGQRRPMMIDAPHSVLVEVLKRAPGIQIVQHDDFRLSTPVPLESVLSDVELAIHKLLSSRGGIAARFTINKELLEAGTVKHVALQLALDSSPIISRLDSGVFSLRGSALTPEALVKASEEVGGGIHQQRKAAFRAADADGYYTFQFEFTDYIHRTRFLDAPTVFAGLLSPGPYEVDGFDSPVIYAPLGSGGHRLNKLVRKLIDAGIKVGDQVVLNIHPDLRKLRFNRLSDDPASQDSGRPDQ